MKGFKLYWKVFYVRSDVLLTKHEIFQNLLDGIFIIYETDDSHRPLKE
jgi:hypothetical protein